MRARFGLIATLAISAALLAPAGASAAFGINGFDVAFTNQDGTPATQAGSHPYAMTVTYGVNYTTDGSGSGVLEGDVKDFLGEQAEGFVGDATAMARCPFADFVFINEGRAQCQDSTAVGQIAVALINSPYDFFVSPVFNLVPPPGAQARLGFSVQGVEVVVDVGIKSAPPYNVLASTKSSPQPVQIFGAKLQLWGNPSSRAHDRFRGNLCGSDFVKNAASPAEVEFAPNADECPTSAPNRPFITLPRNCDGPGLSAFEANSWQQPEIWVRGSSLTHDNATPPNPQGFTGCGKLGFSPKISSQATTDSAETGTGLDFDIDFHDEGLQNPDGIAQSDIKNIAVTLPEGVTINPSVGEGLGVCTKADYERESLDVAEGQGCPNASKVGTVLVKSPLIEKSFNGSAYLAQQDDPATPQRGAENPFDSLIAIYIVFRDDVENILVKIPAKVEPDPQTGRLVTTVEGVPQFPFSHFNLHFKEGQRAALVSPPSCGTYTTEAKITPWARPSETITTTSSFRVTRGIGGGPCPPGGLPPFHPSFQAGAINNNAGSFSPFNMRLIREDGEQDMTKFSAVLPPGELGSLAGVAKCPDSAIPVARAKTGRQELASPSCPANSLIGHTLAGAGVGSALTYVGGQVYLGGPFHGDPLSVISVTPAVAGPFDAGTVVVRLALTLNPKTAEVEVDGANSDPIPHILKGIVLKLRDLRVYVDRTNFTLNPTSCNESSARAVLFGSYLNVLDPTDDRPVDLSTRYQAANCLNLGFKPKLALNLKGGTKRGGHPGLRAIYTPKKGDANIKGLVVRLPRSAFLDQAHIKTICTRVQFAAKACPARSQYGYIKAWTPLLDTPLEGPVYLRSSDHKLPDLVFDLHGLVDIEVSVRIDSAHGGIRATLENSPDAPLSKVDLRMQGAKKGLIINSRNLCGSTNRANVEFTGQNGKEFSANPEMKPDCGGGRKHKRGAGGR
jgi:hypothetical protein